MVEQEAKWIREIQRRGSREAADRLISAYYDEIYRFVYRQVGHKDDAMDLTQSIFVAVLRALPGYDAKKSAFRTWLYRIAANKVIDSRRRARPREVPIDEAGPITDADFLEGVHNRDMLERIERRVSELDSREQAVFRLRVYGEGTFPEIAEALGEPEAAVKSRWYRLAAKLRKEFADNG